LNGNAHFTKHADHEFYVMGYFIEIGIAHHRATGDRFSLTGKATRICVIKQLESLVS
jgi:hypothetical protein